MSNDLGKQLAQLASETQFAAEKVSNLLDLPRRRGYVALERDAADYIHHDDPRIADLVVGGSDWARYTALLYDGTLYQEGGSRRTHFMPAELAKKALAEKAKLAVESDQTLYQRLNALFRARNTPPGLWNVDSALGADKKLIAEMEKRVVKQFREGFNTPITEKHLLKLLDELGIGESELKELAGDKQLTSEQLAQIAAAPGYVDPAEKVNSDFRDFLADGGVLLSGAVLDYLNPADFDDEHVVASESQWWTSAIYVDKSSLQLQGGRRRVRITDQKSAQKLVDAHAKALIDESRLRVLLRTRALSESPPAGPNGFAAIGADEKLLKKLDAAIVKLAAKAEPIPPFSSGQAATMRKAGVDEETLRRLSGVKALDQSTLDAIAEEARSARDRDPTRTLLNEIDRLLAEGGVELHEDTVNFLEPTAPEVEEVVEGVKIWGFNFAARLKKGDIHLEGGRRRLRICSSKRAEELIAARMDQLVSESDLHALLGTMARLEMGYPGLSAYNELKKNDEYVALLHKQVRDNAEKPEYEGKISQKFQQRLLETAGVSEELIRKLAGEKSLEPAALQEMSARLTEARKSRANKSQSLLEAIEEALEKGFVELHEDTVPFLPSDDKQIVELHRGALQGFKYVAVMKDKSIHLEGGRRRQRICPDKVAKTLISKRIDELLGEKDLFNLLETAARLKMSYPYLSVYGEISKNDEFVALLKKMLRDRSEDPEYLGKVRSKFHLSLLEEADVPEERLHRLSGKKALKSDEVAAIKASTSAARKASANLSSTVLAEWDALLESGYLQLHEDTVPFLAKDDKQIVELHEGLVSGFKYLAKLKDKSMHLEAGRRRQRICSEKVAKTLISERIDQLLGEKDLFNLLETAARLKMAYPYLSVYNEINKNDEFVGLLHKMLRECSEDPQYQGRVRSNFHQQLLEQAGVPAELRHRLSGKKALKSEDIAAIKASSAAARKASANLSSTVLAEWDALLEGDYVQLHEDTVPFLAKDDKQIVDLYEGLVSGYKYLAKLKDKSMHLEAGRRRLRICPPKEAQKLLGARIDQLLGDDDLFGLLDTAARLKMGFPYTNVYGEISKNDEFVALLHKKTRERAADPAYDGKVKNPFQLSLLEEAGLDEKRLAELQGVDFEAQQKIAVAKKTLKPAKAQAEEKAAALSDLLAEKEAAGMIWLSGKAVPYVGPGDADVDQVFPSAGDFRFVALLSDGSVYLDGGAQRRRLLSQKDAATLVTNKLRGLTQSPDLITLLELYREGQCDPNPLTIGGALAGDAKLQKELAKSILKLAKEERYNGRFSRAVHRDALEEIGVAEEDLARLFGDKGLPPSAMAAIKTEIKKVITKDPKEDFYTKVGALIEQGYVELYEDTVPFLSPTDLNIREMTRNSGQFPAWVRYAAELKDGSLHMEGGSKRSRLCKPAVAEQLMELQALAMLESDDLFKLLKVAFKVPMRYPFLSVYRYINEHENLLEDLDKRLTELARDPKWDGRIKNKTYLDRLEEAGVIAARLAALEGVEYVSPEEKEARQKAAAEARAAKDAEGNSKLAELSNKAAEGDYVWLTEESVAYVDPNDPRVEIHMPSGGDYRYTAILDDGSIYQEGGTTRRWCVPADQVEAILRKRADEILAGNDIFKLLQLLLFAQEEWDRASLPQLLATDDKLLEAFHKRVVELSDAPNLRINRGDHLDLLIEAGVPSDRLSSLAG